MENNLQFDIVVTDVTEIAKKRGIFDAKNHINIMIDRNSPSMPKKPELPSLKALTTRNIAIDRNGKNNIQKLQAHIDEIKQYQYDLEEYNKEYKVYENKITELNRFGSDVIFNVILRITNFYDIVPKDDQAIIINLIKNICDARFMSTDTLHEIVKKIVSDYKWQE